MAGATLGSVYYPLVTLFPVFLALLLLGTGKLTAPRAGVALVLLAGGGEALLVTSETYGWGLDELPGGMDGLIGITLAFLASQFPSALGGSRGARTATAAWLAALAGWIVLYEIPGPLLPFPIAFVQVVHDASFVLAGGLLASHTIPRALTLAPGPLRAQALLVSAGIGMALIRLLTAFGLEGVRLLSVVPEGAHPAVALAVLIPLWLAGGYFVAAALGQAVFGAARRRSRDGLMLVGALSLGVAVGVLDHEFGSLFTGFRWGASGEFLSQAMRPLLLAIATVQYDMFLVPRSVRRPVLLASGGLFAVSLFAMLSALLSGQGFFATALNPLAAIGAVLVLLGVLNFARGPLAELFGTGGEGKGRSEEQRARLERYRLALEHAQHRAKLDGGAADAERTQELGSLRLELGISRQQHAALASVVEGHLVIPTVALVGAGPGTVVQGRYEVLRELGRGGQGRYEVLRELGRGGQGRVLVARDRIDDEEVVLKEVLRPWEDRAEEGRLALQREAALVAGLSSPHLPRTHGIVTEPWQTYLVREFVPGRDLEKLVAEEGPLPPGRAAQVLDDVLEGLATLHAAGVLHLDVKPANVVVRPEGRAVLIDHGTARRIALPSKDTTKARPGSGSAISLLWAAPEQVNEGAVGAPTDVYQVGGLLYFLLTGRPPVEGEGWGEVERRVAAAPRLAWSEGVPEALRRLADQARAAEPAKRFADARAMRRALDGTREGLPPPQRR